MRKRRLPTQEMNLLKSGEPSKSREDGGDEGLLSFVDVKHYYPTTGYFHFCRSQYSEVEKIEQSRSRTLEESIRHHYHDDLEDLRNRVLYGYASQMGECVVSETFPTMIPIPQPLYTWIDTITVIEKAMSTLTAQDMPKLLMAFSTKISIKRMDSDDPDFPVQIEELGNRLAEEVGPYTPYEWQNKGEELQIKESTQYLESYLFAESFKKTQPQLTRQYMEILGWGSRAKLDRKRLPFEFTGKPDAYSRFYDRLYFVVEFKKPPALLKHEQNVAYLLAASYYSKVPVVMLATNLVDAWSLYWVTQDASGYPCVRFYKLADPNPEVICWLIRQAFLASLAYYGITTSGLSMEPDPDSKGGRSEEDKKNYKGRGFRRIIPKKSGLFEKSTNEEGSGVEEAMHGVVGISEDNPIFAAVAEDVERAMIPEEEFEGSKEEYEKEKKFYQTSAYYQIIYGSMERFPSASPAELAQRYMEEEAKEDEVNNDRFDEHEHLARDRIQRYMEGVA